MRNTNKKGKIIHYDDVNILEDHETIELGVAGQLDVVHLLLVLHRLDDRRQIQLQIA